MDVEEERPVDKNEDPEGAALAAKARGNELYKQGKYRAAIEAYTSAIGLHPEAAYYNNRAAAQIMLMDYEAALKDAKVALSKDESNPKYHLRAGKSYLSLGRFTDAKRHYDRVLELDASNATAKKESECIGQIQQLAQQAADAADKGRFNNSVSLMSKALDLAPKAVNLRLQQALYYRSADKPGDAERIASGVLRDDGMHAQALYVRGLCLYDRNEMEQAIAHFRRALQSNPDHKESRAAMKLSKKLQAAKEAGTVKFKAGEYEEALVYYKEALEVDPSNDLFNAKLHFNCAVVNAKLDNNEQAIEDCTRALELDDGYIKALLKRGELRLKIEQYEEAVQDYEQVVDKEPSNRDHREALRRAKLELKKSKRKDYYKLLGCPKDASDYDIKKAYKKAALRCHPDRVPEEEKEEAEAKFKEIGEAYAVLSDPQKKRRYDNGEDLEDMNHGHGHGGMDPSDIFAQMFAGGFGGGGGFGRGGFGGGFPGAGFHFADDDEDGYY
eukprot:TRINITY_DN7476_c0_g2_i1.p1 TRINITY_DN7476_c0_g2~~TRINITY_DN7476_c0_g2_i1.p1  ORF type:complete len:527 (+),score=172.59 TRINITY_DN7476_c0_g2_i1:87-1583(+)